MLARPASPESTRPPRAERSGRADRAARVWPRYDAAITGFPGYWYPAAWSSIVRRQPVAIDLLDDRIVLLREHGQVRALRDQCPHRGIPLRVGRRELPGTWTCRYHGWTFDTETGVLKAALTDGPDSPICGKVRVRTYPVAERAGLIWVYMGEDEPPPVETDIPSELLDPANLVLGRVSIQQGNWRYAMENGFDEGHAKYLHRYGCLDTFFRVMPVWSTIAVIEEDEGWITRQTQSIAFEDDFPGLGHWPPKRWWKSYGEKHVDSVRLPCIARDVVPETGLRNYIWCVPIGKDRHRLFQLQLRPARGLTRLWAHLRFWAFGRWVHLHQFAGQDMEMVRLMPETMPERLYRPDVSIVAWRRLCENARGLPPEEPPGAAPAEIQHPVSV